MTIFSPRPTTLGSPSPLRLAGLLTPEDPGLEDALADEGVKAHINE